MARITGYKLNQKLFSNRNHSFFLAFREENGEKVFLKVLESNDFDSQEIIALKREFEIAKSLIHPCIIRVIDFIEFQGGAAIAMEEFEGISLRKYISEKKVPFREFLQIGINLCEALGFLHSNGIIHKDIKPDNILINPSNLNIKIIDFGIASLIPQEDITPENISNLEGTIAYISPEQSGRMNRPLDYRSDLYSLGITLYEMITGTPPFTSKDPMKLIHSHLAKKPVAPSEILPEYPEVISPIILKLLEKSPSKRYKSTTGLKFDLQYCLQLLDNSGIVTNFEIAQKDFSDKLNISQKLYGREKEITALISSFEFASKGIPQVLFVSGSPGIGKSALIYEIRRSIVENSGIFIKGKFDQFNRNIPYSGIIRAFEELIDDLLANNQESLSKWSNIILHELGDNAKLITDVFPKLELIIGKQPELPQLPAVEALNRFNLAFQSFVHAFTYSSNTLVLFLDDLQWADQASIQLLDFILSDTNKRHLLVIGSYRDNEVTPSHPLSKLIQISDGKNNITHIKLNPLKRSDLKLLLADTFNCSPTETEDLSRLIDKKTQRNPFFVNEFIKTLYKKGLVFFDYSENKWDWSIGQIEESNITDNVIELVTELLFVLEPETLEVCGLASCLGNQFDLLTLSIVNEKGVQETANSLWGAIQEGIIVPLNEKYKSISNNSSLAKRIEYKFLHDRVQQAAYGNIPEEKRSEIHLKIGRSLFNDINIREYESKIFDIVNHLNQGSSLITNPTEKQELAKLNFEAGSKAKNSSAFEPAFKYFQSALALLPQNSWTSDYNFTLKLYNEASEMAYLSVKTNELELYTEAIFRNSKNDLDTVNAYLVKISFFGSQGDHEKSVEYAFEILEKLGVKLAHNPNKFNVLVQLISTKNRLRGKSVDDLFNLPQMSSQNWLAAVSVLSIVTGPAYIANINLFILIVFKMIELSIKHGNNRFTSFGYAVYGIVLGGMMDIKGLKKYKNLSYQLLNSYPEDELSCKVNYVLTTLDFLLNPYQSSSLKMQENIQKGLDSGDFLYASYSVFYYFSLKFYANSNLEDLQEELDPYCQKLESLKQNVGLGWTNTFRQLITNLINKKEINLSFSGEHFNEKKIFSVMTESKNISGITLMYVVKGMNSYIFDEYEDSISYLEKAKQSIDSLLSTPMVNAYYFYLALSYVSIYRKASILSKIKIKRFISSAVKVYLKWNEYSPSNNSTRLNILLGLKEYINSNFSNTKKHLLTAISSAEKNELVQEKALAYELLSKLSVELEDHLAFKDYILESRFWYHKWGASAKVNQLEEKYKLKQLEPAFKKAEKFDSSEKTTYSTDSLDLKTIIKASQALSSQVQLEDLFKMMIDIVIENAGATCCTILLKQENKWEQVISKKIIEGNQNLKLETIPFEDSNSQLIDLPISIANYVILTKKSLTISNIKKESKYNKDVYLMENNPISILCFPFSLKGEEKGIIYLENDLLEDAFPSERIKLLSIISSQIAISLENAFLYKTLEQKVESRTADLQEKNIELEKEKKKSDKLLLNILPPEIATELKDFGFARAKRHAKATVMFVDVKGFTSIAENMEPENLVNMLDKYFSSFDQIILKYNLEKIKTIGDAYMAVSGVPNEKRNNPIDTIKAAKEILAVTGKLREQLKSKNLPFFEVRIGINTGPLVSGIVGKSKFQFDIWGDSVNVAARLEQTSEPGKINISRSTYEEIKGEFSCTERGILPIKNRSEVEMFYVD